MSDAGGLERREVGEWAPRVPSLATRATGVDHGPAGSLVQARDRERMLHRAEQPPAARDPRVWGGGAVCVAAAGLAAAGLTTAALGDRAPTALDVALVVVAACAAVAGAALLASRWRRTGLDRDLGRRIAQERRAARELDALRSLGWTVLHDRLVPGTQHRMAHVLAGPPGLVLATVLPDHGPPALRDQTLLTGEVPLGEWFATRWWEAEQLNPAVASELTAWQWEGPTYPVALIPAPRRRWLPRRAGAGSGTAFPLDHAGIAVRATEHIRVWATSIPGPLDHLAAAELAAVVERICPPAARPS